MWRHRLCLLFAAGTVAACAPEVVRIPVAAPAQAGTRQHADAIVLAREATVVVGTGYDRTLAAGSRWRFVGVLAEGAVYKAAQGVLTLEGANIHEAYLVIRDGALVGFYLPVERAFSPLKSVVPLSIRDN